MAAGKKGVAQIPLSTHAKTPTDRPRPAAPGDIDPRLFTTHDRVQIVFAVKHLARQDLLRHGWKKRPVQLVARTLCLREETVAHLHKNAHQFKRPARDALQSLLDASAADDGIDAFERVMKLLDALRQRFVNS
jgi:hypothetical protein